MSSPRLLSRILLTSASLALLAVGFARAAPVPAFDRDRLLGEAQVVAVVQANTDEVFLPGDPTGGAPEGRTEMTVHRVLCGGSLPPIVSTVNSFPTRPFAVDRWTTIENTAQGPFAGVAMGVSADHSYLVFLTADTATAQWRVSSSYGLMRVGDLPHDIPSGDCWNTVLFVLRESIGDPDPHVQWNILNVLTAVEAEPGVLAAARGLSTSPDDLVAAKALGYRAKAGDLIDPNEARNLIEASTTLPVYEKVMLANQAITSNEGATTQFLNSCLADSASAIVQDAAVQALIARGDDTSIPALAAALSGSNNEIRSKAHMALARITGRQTSRYEIFVDSVGDPALNWLLWLRDFYGVDLTAEATVP